MKNILLGDAMARMVAYIYLLLGLNLVASNGLPLEGVLVNPYSIEVKENSKNRYEISFQEEKFLSGGEYQDFNAVICDAKIRLALIKLIKNAIEENKYIEFYFNNLKEITKMKHIKTVEKTNRKNTERHEFETVPTDRYFAIVTAKNMDQTRSVFMISNTLMPEVKYTIYTKQQIQRSNNRSCCFLKSCTAKSYYFTQHGISRKLVVENMDPIIAQYLDNLFQDKSITHIEVSEYLEKAVNKGIEARYIFRPVSNGTEQNPTQETVESKLPYTVEMPTYGSYFSLDN